MEQPMGWQPFAQCSIACRILLSCYRQLKIRAFEDSRLAEGSGRPLGTADFVTGL
jgi:hypothetical protein